MKILRFFSILIIVSVLMLTACASSDTTKVTIHFAKNGHASLEQQKLPLIDKIFSLFNSKAYAQIHQTSDTRYYYLYVQGDGMKTISSPLIDGSSTSIAVEVPSGNNRIFTLLSFSLNGAYNYVGQNVTNLAGGNANITINMYPCLNNIDVTNSDGVYISWTFDATLTSYNSVDIYRACIDPLTGQACSSDPIIIPVITGGSLGTYITGYPSGNGYYRDSSGPPYVTEGNIYYYFLSVNIGGTGTGMPHPNNFYDFLTNNYNIAFYMMGVYNLSWNGTWTGTATCVSTMPVTLTVSQTAGNVLTVFNGSEIFTGTYSGNSATLINSSETQTIILYLNSDSEMTYESGCYYGTLTR